MAEQDAQGVAESGASPATDAVRGAKKPPRRKWLYVALVVVVVLPAVLFAVWTTIALNWSYSTGERTGYLQKFSRKGWVCKTWEGEIAMVNMPGAAQERWSFSVRDDAVAAQIEKLMGSRVSLRYAQHRGVPGTCFGETEYFVTAASLVSQP